ncbi:uncharacterized protein C6orf118 homolog [Lissotriton helveticus]
MQEHKYRKQVPLKLILDGMENANKADAKDYTLGHLNHNHLYKPEAFARKSYWESWKTPHKSKPYPTLDSQNFTDGQIQRMKDAWSDFTIKTSIIPGSSRAKSSNASSFGPKWPTVGPNTPISTPFNRSSYKRQESKTITESGPAVVPSLCNMEELEPPEVKLIKFKPVKNRRTCLQDDQGEYTFVPLYLAGLTKRDQMNMLRQFDRDFLKTQVLLEKSDVTRNTTTQILEHKMTQELKSLSDSCPPHFKRLQVISDCFEDLCNESVIFGHLLSQIKDVYDGYLNCLLDSHPEEQYEILSEHIRSMRIRAVDSNDVRRAKHLVKRLEEEAVAALDKNEQFRNELEFVAKHYSEVSGLESEQTNVTVEAEEKHDTPTFIEQFETKRRQVFAAWQELQEVEQFIKVHLIHAIDAQAVERYIQDAKTETTELETSNVFLERACKIVESDVQTALDKQTINLEDQEEIQLLLRKFLQPKDD